MQDFSGSVAPRAEKRTNIAGTGSPALPPRCIVLSAQLYAAFSLSSADSSFAGFAPISAKARLKLGPADWDRQAISITQKRKQTGLKQGPRRLITCDIWLSVCVHSR